MKFTNSNLLVVATIAILVPLPVVATETFNFACGNVEFTVDFEKSTVSDTIDGTANVAWQYDGDWVRWNVRDTDEFYGVNTKTGALILDGVVNEAGCRMGDTSALASLPLSEGAYLRRAFIDLPQQKRMEIQSILSQNGYYSSDIDGKWGRGTEAAIKTYVAENQDEMSAADYTSPEGAANTLSGAMSHMNVNTECGDCQTTAKAFAKQDDLNEEIADPLSDFDFNEFKTLNRCINVGSLSSEALRVTVSARIYAKRGLLDLETLQPIWSSGKSLATEQLFQVLKRAFRQCKSMNINGEVNRTYVVTLTPNGLLLEAYTNRAELKRREVANNAKLEEERRAAEAKKIAKLAEETRKREAELAAKRVAIENVAREKLAATPEKLDEIKSKCRDSLTIFSLCPSLTDAEIATALVGRGYSCANDPLREVSVFFGYKKICEKGSAWVRIEEGNIQFSCGSFNTCSYSVREVGEMLIGQGLTRKMDPSVRVIENVVIEEYCGRGSKNEKLCVRNDFNVFGQSIVVVSLERNIGGTNLPSFD